MTKFPDNLIHSNKKYFCFANSPDIFQFITKILKISEIEELQSSKIISLLQLHDERIAKGRKNSIVVCSFDFDNEKWKQ